MSQLRFATMGCGRIARRHCGILSQSDFGRLAAVCDIIPERARTFGETYDVPHFTDVNTMLQKIQPDVLCVLTPSGLHGRHVLEVCEQVENIVVEKPMVLSLADADRIIERCHELGNRLFVVMQNRFNRPVVKMRQALEAGRFGQLVLGTVRVRWRRDQAYYDLDDWRGTWELDGGVISNQAAHHLDLLEWMMGPVESVSAHAATQLVEIEVPNSLVASLRFVSGALGVVEATTATRPRDLEGSLSILGSRGTVEIGGFAVNEIRVWAFEQALDEDQEVMARYSVNPPDVYGYGHVQYLQHVADCIENGKPMLVDGLDGRRQLELMDAIYHAARTGERVSVHTR
jgi:predicted dehydrogenase